MGIAIAREERTKHGILAMVLAVVFFTCIDTSAKWLILSGLPAIQVVFARYAGHFIFSVLLYFPQEGKAAFISNSPKLQLLRSIFLMGGTVLNFYALIYLPITVTTTIMFAGPIAVTLLAIPILGEHVGIRRIIAVCIGFLGVLVVTQPWGAAWHPAMLLSLTSLCCASLYFILTRMLAGVESIATQQIWSSAVAVTALLPFIVKGWIWPETPLQWLIFSIIGVLGALGHIFATMAHRWADASILAPMIYTQIIFVTFAGIVVFNTYPTVWTLTGAAIIIASGLYIWQRERVLKAKAKPETA